MSHLHPHLLFLLTLCSHTGSAVGKGVCTGGAVLPVTSTIPLCPMTTLEIGLSLGLSGFLDFIEPEQVLHQI